VKSTHDVVSELKLHEAYDILDAMKRIVDEDSGERAKGILEAHPQLVDALLQIQVSVEIDCKWMTGINFSLPASPGYGGVPCCAERHPRRQ
jgi:hypothetical protein